MSDDDWPHVCVLCAARDRHTRLKYGHCCATCADRLRADIRTIADLAAQAAAWLAPANSTSGGGHSVPSSRPPVNVEALSPELTLIGIAPAPTVLDAVESWTRMIRDDRGLAPYGPWSTHRAMRIAAGSNGTDTTLISCTSFLAASVEYVVSEPSFPVDDFADEMRACVRALRRFDQNAEDKGTLVLCPTLNDDGECSNRLHYRDWDEHVTCRRCGVTRDASTLVLVAMSDGRDIWLDPEAAAQWLGVTEGTLRQWARKGRIQRDHGRYRIVGEKLMA